MTKHARLFLAVVAVAALGFTACGGDDDDSTSANADTNSTISKKDADAVAKATGVDRECIEGVQAYGALGDSAGAAFSGGTELDKSIKAWKAWADAAPDAIQDDVGVIADAYTDYFKAIADSGYNPSSGKPPTEEQAAALGAAGEKLNADDVTTANDNVSAYFDEHCKPGAGR